MKIAVFRCWSCKLVFKAKPGPVSCVKCGGIWLDWVNYWQHDWLR